MEKIEQMIRLAEIELADAFSELERIEEIRTNVSPHSLSFQRLLSFLHYHQRRK